MSDTFIAFLIGVLTGTLLIISVLMIFPTGDELALHTSWCQCRLSAVDSAKDSLVVFLQDDFCFRLLKEQ